MSRTDLYYAQLAFYLKLEVGRSCVHTEESSMWVCPFV